MVGAAVEGAVMFSKGLVARPKLGKVGGVPQGLVLLTLGGELAAANGLLGLETVESGDRNIGVAADDWFCETGESNTLLLPNGELEIEVPKTIKKLIGDLGKN